MKKRMGGLLLAIGFVAFVAIILYSGSGEKVTERDLSGAQVSELLRGGAVRASIEKTTMTQRSDMEGPCEATRDLVLDQNGGMSVSERCVGDRNQIHVEEDEGAWRVDGDALCLSYRRMEDGEQCFTVRLVRGGFGLLDHRRTTQWRMTVDNPRFADRADMLAAIDRVDR